MKEYGKYEQVNGEVVNALNRLLIEANYEKESYREIIANAAAYLRNDRFSTRVKNALAELDQVDDELP